MIGVDPIGVMILLLATAALMFAFGIGTLVGFAFVLSRKPRLSQVGLNIGLVTGLGNLLLLVLSGSELVGLASVYPVLAAILLLPTCLLIIEMVLLWLFPIKRSGPPPLPRRTSRTMSPEEYAATDPLR